MKYWNDIKDNYPKAFNKLLKWDENGEMYFFDKIRRGTFTLRDLFRFFDLTNLTVVIAIEYTYTGHDKSILFYSNIYHDEMSIQNPIHINKRFLNRIEAEEEAFLTAFKILEDKL